MRELLTISIAGIMTVFYVIIIDIMAGLFNESFTVIAVYLLIGVVSTLIAKDITKGSD